MRILVVEDDIESGCVTRGILEHMGHTVRWVTSAADALRFLDREECDAAVIDVVLPDSDGFALLGRIRNLLPAVTCLLVTGHYLPDGEERAKRLRAGFRVKPLDFEEVEAFLLRE